jgi:ABC-type transport system involved in multi-copper enzyme maturation permease subunit
MLGHFIRKEILDSLLNMRFMALAVFSIVLMPLSALINYEYFQERRAAFDSQYAEYNTEEPNWWDLRVYRPPMLLSSLGRGTEPYMPIYYAFTDDADATRPGNIEAQEFSALSTFGSFDLLFLVQVVFSLLAVLLAFDMVAGEKERGTLRAVLANPVPRDTVLLGKFIGGFLVLWMVFLIGALLLYLILVLFDGRFASPEMLGRIGFIFVLATLFLGAFYSLGLMVSVFCHSTRTAIVALLVVWVVLQLVIPKAGEMISSVVVPVRSQEAVRIEKRKVIEDLDEAMQNKGGEDYTRLTGRPDFEGAFELLGSDAPEAEQFKAAYQEMARGYEQQKRDRVREIDMDYLRQKEHQRNVSRLIALLSPAPALTFLLTDAAGTGDLAYQNYRDAVMAHYQIIDREVYSKRRSQRYQIRLGGSSISSNFGGGSDVDLEAVPAFTIKEPELRNVLWENAWALATILIYLVVPFVVAYVAFLRYVVR